MPEEVFRPGPSSHHLVFATPGQYGYTLCSAGTVTGTFKADYMLEINEYQASVVLTFIEEHWCDFIDCCYDHCDKDALTEDGDTLAKDISVALGDEA